MKPTNALPVKSSILQVEDNDGLKIQGEAAKMRLGVFHETLPSTSSSSAPLLVRSLNDDSPTPTENRQPSDTTATPSFTLHNPLIPSGVTTVAPLSTSSDDDKEHKGLSTAAQTGIGVGVALAAIWIVVGAFFLFRVRRKTTNQSRSEAEAGNGKLRINGKTFAVSIQPDTTNSRTSASRHDVIEMEALTNKPAPPG
jgi:hypothetical protein